jgi:pyruvate,orthophosphate dikinase
VRAPEEIAAGLGALRSRWVSSFSAGAMDQTSLLGGKGANLAELTTLEAPVPPGFVITTEACAAYARSGVLPDGLEEELRASLQLLSDGERRFGDPRTPLLVSVRSGAPTSMPGMMDTILNVGLTPDTVSAFAAWIGSEQVARDCMSRLSQGFSVSSGETLPEDPFAQLTRSVEAVFDSWNSRRARLYRRYNKISDAGTAVVVQAMVFGNAPGSSGTGVVFTRDPSSGERRLFGEYLAGGQGEDVVSGTLNVDDLQRMARESPAAFTELEQLAERFERHFRDMCEIELTLERGRLWILQVRRGQRSALATVRIAVQLAEEGTISRAEALERVDVEVIEKLAAPRLDAARLDPASVLTRGTGSSPGLVTGKLVLSAREAVKRASAGERVILARRETSPEDLDGMIACTGLLTSTGGKTSHAAVVARGLGRTCVCGAQEIELDLERGCLRVGEATVQAGEVVSLDGDGGRVIRGEAPTLVPQLPPEAGLLTAWHQVSAERPGR